MVYCTQPDILSHLCWIQCSPFVTFFWGIIFSKFLGVLQTSVFTQHSSALLQQNVHCFLAFYCKMKLRLYILGVFVASVQNAIRVLNDSHCSNQCHIVQAKSVLPCSLLAHNTHILFWLTTHEWNRACIVLVNFDSVVHQQ